MVKNSLKQLLRSPGKAIMFLLLIIGCSVLIVLGAGMCMRSAKQIQAAEDEYVTIGMVTQRPIADEMIMYVDPCKGVRDRWETTYGRLITAEDLTVEGIDFIQPPERRPMYITYQPDLKLSKNQRQFYSYHESVVEFKVLEDSENGSRPVEAEITRILYQDESKGLHKTWGDSIYHPAYKAEVGDTILVCQHMVEGFDRGLYPMEAGKTYVASLEWDEMCGKHEDREEYIPFSGAATSQYDKEGHPVESELFPTGVWENNQVGFYFQEVTEDFYEPGHPGVAWENLAKIKEEMIDHVFPVVGANSLNLLPSYYNNQFTMDSGREITQEEFDSGAKVCMMTRDIAIFGGYSVGQKIKLPLLASLYGMTTHPSDIYVERFNLINAQGEIYEPFWEEEYEIVGLYTINGSWAYGDCTRDMFIIPEKSVLASDEDNIAYFGPMLGKADTSFQLPNGSIEEYDLALRASLPEAEFLSIEYDDMGYAQVVEGLRKALYMGVLLLAAGMLASVAVVVLLMYFFITREKKRTAVERSLGLTRRQCRVSLLAGIMTLTLLGTIVGSGISCVLLSLPDGSMIIEGEEEELEPTPEPEEPTDAERFAIKDETDPNDPYDFSMDFSMWVARLGIKAVPLPIIEAGTLPWWLFLAIPVVLSGLVLALGIVFVDQNLKIEPIYLLSVKE